MYFIPDPGDCDSPTCKTFALIVVIVLVGAFVGSILFIWFCNWYYDRKRIHRREARKRLKAQRQRQERRQARIRRVERRRAAMLDRNRQNWPEA